MCQPTAGPVTVAHLCKRTSALIAALDTGLGLYDLVIKLNHKLPPCLRLRDLGNDIEYILDLGFYDDAISASLLRCELYEENESGPE